MKRLETHDAGRTTQDTRRTRGSAIILAIVLTSLLAIIGVMFLLSSRVDSVATSAISENKDLSLAVDTVITQISEKLALDVPGCIEGQDYYDYPDINNLWLASLEPNSSGSWPHITDITNQFGNFAYDFPTGFLKDYQAANQIGDSSTIVFYPADADGDGIGDSAWIKLPGVTSSKGKPIFAAIRVIDNGGMLNVNTGLIFDPAGSIGKSQMDINLMALAGRPGYAAAEVNNLLKARNLNGLGGYEQGVIWEYNNPDPNYTPYDISDELEMRNRFVLNHSSIDTRLENWSGEFRNAQTNDTPFDTNLAQWFRTAYDGGSLTPEYSYRHLATTYNYDRVINPSGNKMVNINTASQAQILGAVQASLSEATTADVNALAAQITANLIDYVDTDSNVTVVYDSNSVPHYGFEQPCIYISELAQNFYQPDSCSPDITFKSYAIELFKPYWEDDEPNGWQIVTTDSAGLRHTSAISWTGSRRFHVITNIDTSVAEANIPIDINEIPGPNEVNLFDPNKFNRLAQQADINFAGETFILLQRNVNGEWITFDGVPVPLANTTTGWLNPNKAGFATLSIERDIKSIHRCIREIISPTPTLFPTLGSMNNFVGEMIGNTAMIQAHPANRHFMNIGEFGQIFFRSAYDYGGSGPWPGILEQDMRINLADANLPYQQVFKYLTVMDPCDHGWPGETRIKGRININTAPWYVIAQLPWISYHTPSLDLARSIANYRDNTGGFRSIGELMNVVDSNISPGTSSIAYYADKATPAGLLTPPDGAGDIFEQRDSIFARISNLVTVRSDVFTAYILVRIGTDGPQKRAIAILDRSRIIPDSSAPGGYSGKVKIVAIQMVPDPR